MKRAALYARISTQEGRQHLRNQLDKLQEFAARMNWTIAGTFTDQVSGSADKRPGLDELMKAAARRDIDVVLVFELSRLTRGGPLKALEYLNRLNHSQVEFWSMTEEFFARPARPVRFSSRLSRTLPSRSAARFRSEFAPDSIAPSKTENS